MEFPKYQITLNGEQAHLLSMSLDFYSRIAGGQFKEIINRFLWGACDDKDLEEAKKILTRLKFLLTGMEDNSNIGIGNIIEDGRNAYDLHQVIRHRLALDRVDHQNKLSVDFRSPHQWGTQPLAEIVGLEQ